MFVKSKLNLEKPFANEFQINPYVYCLEKVRYGLDPFEHGLNPFELISHMVWITSWFVGRCVQVEEEHCSSIIEEHCSSG